MRRFGLALLLLSGCYESHRLPTDGGPFDAGCMRARVVSRTCDVRWARAFGASTSATGLGLGPRNGLAVTAGGVVVASFFGTAPDRLRIDGLDVGGDAALAVDGETGRALWARDGVSLSFAAGSAAYVRLHSSVRGVYPVETRRARDGALLREAVSNAYLIDVAGSCEGCASVSAFSWEDHIDLGPLGTEVGLLGQTIVGDGPDGPWARTWTFEGDVMMGGDITPTLAADGSFGMAWHFDRGSAPYCVFPSVCIAPPLEGVFVAMGPTGELRWSSPVGRIGGAAMLAEGDAVVAIDAAVSRFGADGTLLWSTPVLSESDALAVDETSRRVWISQLVPRSVRTLGAATLGDCPRDDLRNFLVELDLETGAVVDVVLPAEGLTLVGLAAIPGGGVAVEASLREGSAWYPATSTFCGVPLEAAGAFAEVLLAVID